MPQPPKPLDPSLSERHRFGSELRTARVREKLSQAQLASRLHVHPDLIAKIEKADRWPTEDLAISCDKELNTGGRLAALWPAVAHERYEEKQRSLTSFAVEPVDRAQRLYLDIEPNARSADMATLAPNNALKWDSSPRTIQAKGEPPGSLRHPQKSQQGTSKASAHKETGLQFTVPVSASSPQDAATLAIMANGQCYQVQLSRRGTLLAAAGSLMSPLLNGSKVPPRKNVDPAVITHFSSLRAILVDSDNLDGPGSLLPAVRYQLRIIAELRRRTRGELHRQLLSCEARWAEFASWLYDDLGDNATSEWWLGQAMSMAPGADDRDFQAYLFARSAQRLSGTPNEDRVIGLCEAAARVGTRNRNIRAFTALQRAHGYAALGERRPFEAAVAQAHSEVDSQHARHGDFGEFCTPRYILAEEARGWLRLRQPKVAVERYSEALALWPATYQRDRGLYLARTATAHVDNGEPDRAASTALDALRLATTNRSARTRKEVVSVGERLRGFADREAVQELFDALSEPSL